MRRKAFRVEETLRVIDHVNIHWTSIHLKIIPIDLLTKTTSATVHVALPPYLAVTDRDWNHLQAEGGYGSLQFFF